MTDEPFTHTVRSRIPNGFCVYSVLYEWRSAASWRKCEIPLTFSTYELAREMRDGLLKAPASYRKVRIESLLVTVKGAE